MAWLVTLREKQSSERMMVAGRRLMNKGRAAHLWALGPLETGSRWGQRGVQRQGGRLSLAGRGKTKVRMQEDEPCCTGQPRAAP